MNDPVNIDVVFIFMLGYVYLSFFILFIQHSLAFPLWNLPLESYEVHIQTLETSSIKER